MKKLFAVAFVVALVWLAPTRPSVAQIGVASGVGGVPSTLGATTFSSTVASTRPCATNYTRVGPNFCASNNGVSAGTITNATACTLQSSVSGLQAAGALWIVLQAQVSPLSQNSAAATDGITVQFYADASCTKNIANYGVFVREFVATVAGTTISTSNIVAVVPLLSTDKFATTMSCVPAANGCASFNSPNVVGYFD